MNKVFYARWYSGVAPAVFRLHYDSADGIVTAADTWGVNGWEPTDWNQIRDWVTPIHPEELPSEVTP